MGVKVERLGSGGRRRARRRGAVSPTFPSGSALRALADGVCDVRGGCACAGCARDGKPADPYPFRHQHAGHDRARNAAERPGRPAKAADDVSRAAQRRQTHYSVCFVRLGLPGRAPQDRGSDGGFKTSATLFEIILKVSEPSGPFLRLHGTCWDKWASYCALHGGIEPEALRRDQFPSRPRARPNDWCADAIYRLAPAETEFDPN